jgi:hypothetical protein
LKHRHELIVLALVLLIAAPAFADKIRGTDPTQEFSDKDAALSRGFGLAVFPNNVFRIEPDSGVRMGEFGEGRELSDPDTLRLGSGQNDPQVRLLDLGSKHGDSFRWDEEKAWKNHKKQFRDDGEGSSSAVAIPEPGSLTLLLFGMVVLGIIVYRHNTPTNTF